MSQALATRTPQIDLAGMREIAEVLSKSRMIPRDYIGNPANIIVAMLRGARLGFDPIQSMEGIAMVNGKATLYGDHFLGVIIAAPGYDGHEEMTFDEIQEKQAATCTFYRNKRRYSATFSVDDAVRAGLWKKTGPWTNYPSRMLQMRARGFAGRNGFSDALKGLWIYEEAVDMETGKDPMAPKVTRDELIAQQQVKPPAPEKVLEVVDVVEVVEVVEDPQNSPQMTVKFSPKKKATKKVTKKAPDKTPPPPTKGMAK